MSLTYNNNERGIIGSNSNSQSIDYAQDTMDTLSRDYAELAKNVDKLLAEAREFPVTIELDDEKTFSEGLRIEKELRNAAARAEAFRIVEKEPFLRRGTGVDNWFFGLVDKLARRKKENKAGAADIIHARIHDYNERKLAREEAKRREEARLAAIEAERLRKIAEEEQRKADDARRQQEEAAAAAERARKAENIQAHQQVAQQHAETAVVHEVAATVTARAAEDAEQKTTDAMIDANRKPADMVRTRTESGHLSTMGTEGYAEIEAGGRAKLNYVKLAPYFTEAHVDAALKRFAKATDYAEPMEGALIGKRRKTINR